MNNEASNESPGGNPLAFMARATPQLRATIGQQQATLAECDFADLMENIRSVFDKFSAKLQEFDPGPERAIALHLMLDKELKAASHLPLSCAKGCTACCHYEVEITQDEADLLHELVTEGFPVDRHRLEVQAARERKSPEWEKFFNPENRCVFLDADGACGIYEHRPSICRKHIVTSPPESCSQSGAQVWPVQVLFAEILLSAALSITGANYASMAKLLHARMAPQ